MNYKEMGDLDKAFLLFITKQKRRNKIKIIYQLRLGRRTDDHYAFIGYQPDTGGFHGIHYNGQRDTYYFGTRDKKAGLHPEGLIYSQENKIPAWLKEAMREVIKAKTNKSIRRPVDGWDGLK